MKRKLSLSIRIIGWIKIPIPMLIISIKSSKKEKPKLPIGKWDLPKKT